MMMVVHNIQAVAVCERNRDEIVCVRSSIYSQLLKDTGRSITHLRIAILAMSIKKQTVLASYLPCLSHSLRHKDEPEIHPTRSEQKLTGYRLRKGTRLQTRLGVLPWVYFENGFLQHSTVGESNPRPELV
jgi:hypothetical protein